MEVHNCVIVFYFLLFAFFKVTDCSDVSIVGGKDVKTIQPWMVSIQKYQRHVCGGVLIGHQWVLTAAHCKLALKNTDFVTVLVGTLSLKEIQKHSQRIGILSYYEPRSLNVESKEHDIMLIKLSKKVKGKPKKLPKKEKDIKHGEKCVVMGWGTKYSKGTEASDKLQMLQVTVVDRDKCKQIYNKIVVITKDMLCAGNTEPNRETCWGDSGGPLECKKNIVGIVSGGIGCGDPKKPTVYTFLSKQHIFWINSILKKHFNSTMS